MTDSTAHPQPQTRPKSPLLAWQTWFFFLLFLAGGVLAANYFLPRPIVGVIRLEYDIWAGSVQFVIDQIDEARLDPRVKAILLHIDSPGGEVAASQSLYLELLALRKEMPVVGSIESMAASGGYYTIVAADPIYARPSSTVGNIGAWSYTPMDLPVNELILATGPFKLTATNNEAFVRELEGIKQEFLATVVAQRGSRLLATPVELSQGLAYPGRQALELGLIDFLGSDTDAAAQAAELAGIANYEIVELQERVLEKYRQAQEGSGEDASGQPPAVPGSWVGAADPLTNQRLLPPGIYLLYDVRLRREK